MPYGVKPLSFTTGLYCGLASPTVACSTVLTMSAFIRSTSTPAFAVNGTDHELAFPEAQSLENGLVVAVTETTTAEDVETLAAALEEALA